MRRLTSTVTPQGVVGVAPFGDVGLETLPADGCWTILHEVRDPGNAGTVLRSSDAAGAGAVVFTIDPVDVYNPKTVRASAGSLFHLPVVRGVETARCDRSREGRRGARDRDGRRRARASLRRRPRRSGGLRLRQRSARPSARGAGARRCRRACTARGTGGVAEPRSGGHGVHVRVGTAQAGRGGARSHDRGGRARHPIAAHRDERVRLRAREAVGDHDRGPARPDAAGIVHDADRMDKILRLLVDAARVSAGHLELFPEQIDLGELIRTDARRSAAETPTIPPIGWTGEPAHWFSTRPG